MTRPESNEGIEEQSLCVYAEHQLPYSCVVSVKEYLEEVGSGAFANYLVRDLIPPKDEVDVLLLLESPHIDELRTGIPLSGEAGQAALSFLMPDGAPPEALGPSIIGRHELGNARVGIMNVSQVPLQLAAFSRHRSRQAVAHLDWTLLGRVRGSTAATIDDIVDIKVQMTSRLLLPSLESRMTRVRFSTGATVVPAGKFAQQFWNSVARRPPTAELPIPHPSNDWWTRATAKSDIDNLAALRLLLHV